MEECYRKRGDVMAAVPMRLSVRRNESPKDTAAGLSLPSLIYRPKKTALAFFVGEVTKEVCQLLSSTDVK
jgi:hypothetical protein